METSIETPNWYWEAIITCQHEYSDLLINYLFEQGLSGVEEINDCESSTTMKCYFDASISDPRLVIELIIEMMAVSVNSINILEVRKHKIENWQQNWKQHFKPLTIGKNFLVVPPWEIPKSKKKIIVIEPGFGFGTGYHESTNIALQLLEWVFEQQQVESALDVGTGSGILAIAAKHLGVSNLVAVDIDKDAIKEVESNLILSGLDTQNCKILVGDPREIELEAYDLVMANIEDFILSEIAEDLLRLTNNGGIMVLSGILTERKSALLQKFKGVRIEKELSLNEWTGLVFKKQ